MGFISRSPGVTWPVSRIRARASCCESGLSSTDERVRGHVTEVTQALRKSSNIGPRVADTYSRDYLNTNRPRLDLLAGHVSCSFMSAAASAKHENFVMSKSYFTHIAIGAAPDRQIDFTHVAGPSEPSQSSPQGRGADGPGSPSLPAMAQT